MGAVKQGDNVLIAARVNAAYNDTGRLRVTPLDASGVPCGKPMYLAAGVAVLPPKQAAAEVREDSASPKILIDGSGSMYGALTDTAWTIAKALVTHGADHKLHKVTHGGPGTGVTRIHTSDDLRKGAGGLDANDVVRYANQCHPNAVIFLTDRSPWISPPDHLPENLHIVDLENNSSLKSIFKRLAHLFPEVDTDLVATPTETTDMPQQPNPILDVNLTALAGYSGRDVAAVKLSLVALGRTIEVEGSAKRQHPDQPYEEIGQLLALGRALRQLGGILEGEGKTMSESACDQHDHNVQAVSDTSNFQAMLAEDVVPRARHDRHVEWLNSQVEKLLAEAIERDELVATQETVMADLVAANEKLAADLAAAKPKPATRTRKAPAKKAAAKPRTAANGRSTAAKRTTKAAS